MTYRSPAEIDAHYPPADWSLVDIAHCIERRIARQRRTLTPPPGLPVLPMLVHEGARMLAEASVAYRRRGGKLEPTCSILVLTYQRLLQQGARRRTLRFAQQAIAQALLRAYPGEAEEDEA